MNAKMRQVREKAKRKGIIFIANKFEDCPIAEAIGVIGKQRHRDLLAKAGANGWDSERLDLEIRRLADEVASKPFDVWTLEGQRIPVTKKHLAEDNPVEVALMEALGSNIVAKVCMLSEEVAIFERTAAKLLMYRITLFTAGTFDEWILQHDDDKSVPSGTLVIFREGDRLWIGFEETSK